jgi:uncharacterized protein (TIGR02646 family)
MRFVDIELLQLPGDWQQRADEALNELRNEIAVAEAAAHLAGGDPIAARKSAIALGLKRPARQQIWRDLNPHLASLRNRKCWYSESLNPTADKNVDHFRPKNRVAEDPTHEGYWWLAFASSNYRYSSQWCNQRRVDDESGTSGGKWDHFPLCSEYRARLEGDDIQLEIPELLDPVDPDDWKLLTFRPDGHPIPAMQEGTIEYRRAAKSIDVYHLHCRELVEDRRTVASTIQRLVQDLEQLRPNIQDLHMRALYKRRQVDLLRVVSAEAEYSAAALAYARAEIYKFERGHQVEREWLREMLN